MGFVIPTSTIEKMERGEELDAGELAHIQSALSFGRSMRLPLPVLIGLTLCIVAMLVALSIQAF
ncbi:hypothetical protein [Zavarzinella formosa]|uniref:hypothetical protein n=1 Tax=Zavarzinella formosa TaxID=360055 RepID=UPI0002DB4719|nr:hypothetical protein [Zavarzinella formosa]